MQFNVSCQVRKPHLWCNMLTFLQKFQVRSCTTAERYATDMKFGEKVHSLRKKRGLTQAELARLIGVHQRTIAGYERNGRYPNKREIYQKLADVFNVPVNYLYTEHDSSFDEAEAVVGISYRQEAQMLAQRLAEIFRNGKLSEIDIDKTMLVVQKAYFVHKEDKTEKRGRRE